MDTKDTLVSNAIADIEAKMDAYGIDYSTAFDLWELDTIAGPKVKCIVYEHLCYYHEPKFQDYGQCDHHA